MAAPAGSLAGSRLARLAKRTTAAAAAAPEEHCELCDAPIPSVHRHLLELSSRELMCACRPCSLLFDRGGAGNGRYKLVPERRLRLDDFAMSDLEWEELRIPVDMAFLFYSSAEGRVVAYYPGPMGPTESQLELSSWQELERSNPILAEMEPDVEALLVNRVGGARRHWLVPLDECYSLVGAIRTRWRGLTGGSEVWREIERFFEELDRRARSATGRR
ncbi:MAG TPA: DUF5947 family protein [Solirubrobacteraceae bacterium]|jgi:hypothetical protein|nr:DUF5947 family protein [Solirubrobacteraceae bacterium]